METLRHITDTQSGSPFDASFGGFHRTDQSTKQRAFTRSVGADHRDDLAGINRKVDPEQDQLSTKPHRQAAGRDQRHGMPDSDKDPRRTGFADLLRHCRIGSVISGAIVACVDVSEYPKWHISTRSPSPFRSFP